MVSAKKLPTKKNGYCKQNTNEPPVPISTAYLRFFKPSKNCVHSNGSAIKSGVKNYRYQIYPQLQLVFTIFRQ
jgi:hypothetical protein